MSLEPMLLSARPSVSEYLSVMADHTQASLPPKRNLKEEYPDASSAFPWMQRDSVHCAWRYKHASSISSAKKQLQTFVLHRRCSQIWRRCTLSIMDRPD